MKQRGEETYYETLKVSPKATIAEIVGAYHLARSAFSKESVATYSLFSQEDTQEILSKLEEAYHNLSDIDKRRAYDKWLLERSKNVAAPAPMNEWERQQKARKFQKLSPASSDSNEKADNITALPSVPADAAVAPSDPDPSARAEMPLVGNSTLVSGSLLRDIREKRGLSLDDVARITKIPSKFVRAIENEERKQFPARVYLQGFIKNMAVLYRIDPQSAVRSYLEYLDTRTSTEEAR